MQRLILVCLFTLLTPACGSDKSKSTTPDPNLQDKPLNDPNKNQQIPGFSVNDGCGWSFALETDAAAREAFARSLDGEWLEKQGSRNYEAGLKAVKGGESYKDPSTGEEFVSLKGYRFTSDQKGTSLLHLFGEDTQFYPGTDFIAGFPYIKTLAASDPDSFILGKPLTANPEFRPIEFKTESGCNTVLIKLHGDNEIEQIFGSYRQGLPEPSIEEYYNQRSFGMRFIRF